MELYGNVKKAAVQGNDDVSKQQILFCSAGPRDFSVVQSMCFVRLAKVNVVHGRVNVRFVPCVAIADAEAGNACDRSGFPGDENLEIDGVDFIPGGFCLPNKTLCKRLYKTRHVSRK